MTHIGEALERLEERFGLESPHESEPVAFELKPTERPGRERFLSPVVGGQTDGSGNASITLYTCPVGYTIAATRVVVEAVGFTPANPYSAANAWIGIYRAAPNTSQATLIASLGGLLDFGPLVGGGPILPALFVDDKTRAPGLRAHDALIVAITGGPASTSLAAHFQGWLRSE